ncbi:MAG: FtsQ-type POTRA domain-containing protein [Thermoanaerobaculia bacterium]
MAADRDAPFLRRGGGVAKKRRRSGALRLAVLAALGLALAFALFRFLSGPHFSLRRFEVSGNVRTRTEEILDALEEWRGKNVVGLDLAPLATRLASRAWVDRVTLTKRFPDGLAVHVTERKALALYRDGQKFWWVGADGNLIAPYDPRRDLTEYVILTGERRALPEAVGLLGDLRAARPEYFSALSEIASLPDGGFGMMDAIFRRPVRVLRSDAPDKIRALLAARGFIESRGWEARAIDLRFADRVILVGAYGAGNRL